MFNKPLSPPTPAFEQKISIPPMEELEVEMIFLIAASDETSAVIYSTFKSPAVCFKASSLISTITTSAPDSRNDSVMAFPIPKAAPVTITRLPLTSIILDILINS